MSGNTPSGFGVRGERSNERGARQTRTLVTDGGSGRTAIDSVADPAALVERDDVPHRERTYTHEDADHCEADAIGRAVVGVTNEDAEVLLLVRDDAHAILPNCVVDEGEDWAAVARRTVEESTGLRVELDAVQAVRTVEHEVEADGETGGQNTTRHVLFGASPVAPAGERNEPVVTDSSEWEASWYADLPVEVDEEGDVIDDIRTFLE